MQFLWSPRCLSRLIVAPNRVFRHDFTRKLRLWTISSSPTFDSSQIIENNRSMAPIYRFPITERWKLSNGFGCDFRYLRTAASQNAAMTDVASSMPLKNQTRLFTEKKPEEIGEKSTEKTSTDPTLATTTTTEGKEKLTLAQKFKKMWKQYWYVLLPVHGITCTLWFGLFYAISASGLDVIGFLELIHLPESLLNKIKSAPQAGHLVVAFALYKLVMPLRYMTTLGLTYYTVRSLSRLGYIKPMPSRQQLKAMIDVKKDEFKAKRQRWRVERRWILFRKRGSNLTNGHGHQHHQHHQNHSHPPHHPKKKPHD